MTCASGMPTRRATASATPPLVAGQQPDLDAARAKLPNYVRGFRPHLVADRDQADESAAGRDVHRGSSAAISAAWSASSSATSMP